MSQENFYQHYEQAIGNRWPALFQSLQKPEKQIGRRNNFVSGDGELPFCEWSDADTIERVNDVLDYYVMDYASVFPPLALDVQQGDAVLDMCAAPGGKTLILAEQLRGSGRLTVNELSEARRDRLKSVLRQYIPDELRTNLKVTGKPGEKFGMLEPANYQRILLDAPCSGERHTLQNKSDLEKWSPSRSKQLVHRQVALICSAFDALSSEGRLVYSTCSIHPNENDGIVQKLQKKRDSVRILKAADIWRHEWPALIGENTEFGWQIWPDTTEFGPIYFAVLEKA